MKLFIKKKDAIETEARKPIIFKFNESYNPGDEPRP